MIFQDETNTPTNQTKVGSKRVTFVVPMLFWGVWDEINYFDKMVLD
jgi:hypothetical protein